jgi:hypothetical protein
LKHFCTYFDKAYLPQGISLYQSLITHEKESFLLWVLCLDDVTYQVLSSLKHKNVKLISHGEFLEKMPKQRETFRNRSLIEYYYTCTPSLLQYIFREMGNAYSITYIDADMFFFMDSRELFNENENADVVIVPHNFENAKKELELYGHYNVCFVHFRNTENGIACLNWWAEMTFMSTQRGNGVWGDQKYLDEFPRLFNNVHVIQHKGVGAAPWNISQYTLIKNSLGIWIEDEPLIVYHFARLLFLKTNIFIPVRRIYLKKNILKIIYLPYIESLNKAYNDIRAVFPGYRVSYISHNFRGMYLGLLMGRGFIFYKNKLKRIGLSWPIGYER